MLASNPIDPYWQTYIDALDSKKMRMALESFCLVGKKLDVLAFDCPVIIVAGTNGKGSCVRALEAIYLEHGYATAVTSSPHIFHITERARLNGACLTAEQFSNAAAQTKAAAQSTDLTYFEFTTLACLKAMQAHQPDVVILEVGLGGRLDAMNAVHSDLSIITNIDFDHQHILGSTLEAISAEKAGVIHAGQKACVITDTSRQNSIANRAQDQQVPLRVAQKISIPTKLNKSALEAALTAATCLNSVLKIVTDKALSVLSTIELLGRSTFIEINDSGDEMCFDIAHNPAAAQSLFSRLEEANKLPKTILFNAYEDKDILNMLHPFLGRQIYWIIPAIPSDNRAAAPQTIQQMLQQRGESVVTAVDSLSAIRDALQHNAASSNPALVFGGFAIVSQTLKAIDRVTVTQRNESCTIS